MPRKALYMFSAYTVGIHNDNAIISAADYNYAGFRQTEWYSIQGPYLPVNIDHFHKSLL